jgi:hypothetical protein
MSDKLDDFDVMLLRDFVAENWNAFDDFCQERGVSAEEFYELLGGEN